MTPARPPTPLSQPRTARMLGLVVHQARYELLSFRRNRQARFFTILLPVIFLIVLVGVFGNNTIGPAHAKASTYYVPGLSALAIIATCFVNLVTSLTAQREMGILKRRRATPVPAWVLIVGRTLACVIVGIAVMTVLLVIGRFGYGVHLPSTTIPGVLLTALTGSITFCCLGYAISTTISSADSTQPVLQAVMLPLYFISGVFIPGASLPGALQRVARWFPVQHLADGLHHAFDPTAHDSGIAWSDLGILALWGAVGLAVALRRFTWAPHTRT